MRTSLKAVFANQDQLCRHICLLGLLQNYEKWISVVYKPSGHDILLQQPEQIDTGRVLPLSCISVSSSALGAGGPASCLSAGLLITMAHSWWAGSTSQVHVPRPTAGSFPRGFWTPPRQATFQCLPVHSLETLHLTPTFPPTSSTISLGNFGISSMAQVSHLYNSAAFPLPGWLSFSLYGHLHSNNLTITKNCSRVLSALLCVHCSWLTFLLYPSNQSTSILIEASS